MRIFEPHIHMYARVTDDYEAMARAGVEMIVEPAFWLGEPRRHPGTFFDYFNHMLNFETKRAADYGIDHYVTLALNPREANVKDLADAVVKELPKFLDHPRVVGVGEIGFDGITEQEEVIFRRQAELARERKLPILIHSPHMDKLKGIQKNIAILREMKIDLETVCIDHNVEDTTATTRASGAWAGHTVYSWTKLTPERAANIVLEHGVTKMTINSSADWGPSDALSVPKTVDELRRRGVPEKDLETLVWDNPYNFFKKSGRLK